MKGEEQLINLMHGRYMEALRDMIAALVDSEFITTEKGLQEAVTVANKLSTMNVDNYGKKWGKLPNPQKLVTIEQGTHIVLTSIIKENR